MKESETTFALKPDLSTPSGFEQIYKLYWKKLYNICYHHTTDRHLSEELVQDIFKSLWERRGSLVIDTSIENYLSRAARLKVSEHYRNQVSREKNLNQALIHYEAGKNYTQQEVDYNFLSNDLSTLVEALPLNCQKVYQMSRNEGLNNKEIAASLSISEKTVENQITKAMNFLRKNLAKYTLF